MNISIITPTIGTEYLKDCINSVSNQTYRNFHHIIAVDGKEYESQVKDIVGNSDVDVVVIPQNTGKDGYVCHPKYAGFSFLCNTKYILFLDEDNVIHPNHLEYIMNEFSKQEDLDMVYSLRYILDKDGNYVCNDNFESVGNLIPENALFVDTSCICMKTSVAQKYAYFWMDESNKYIFDPKNGKQPHTVRPNDRLFSSTILKECNSKCTKRYTLGYRTYENKPNPPSFFQMNSKHHIVDQWDKKTLYVCHFSAVPTNEGIVNILKKRYNNHAWKESWQLPLLDGLSYFFNLKNGYLEQIPSEALVLFTACHINTLPERVYTRKDVTKVLVAMESPNIRHQQNYSPEFLSHFDKVVTFNTQFKDILGDKYIHTLHPYNASNIAGTTNSYMASKDENRKICCVLENRQNKGEYEVLGVKLRSLDHLRYDYAKHLHIDCYGKGWESDGKIVARGFDPKHPIDIQNQYTFSLIIENQNSAGGVTEKIYNAFLAGCIPLYYSEHPIENIPESCYINITKIKPEDLQTFLSNVDVEQYRKNIVDNLNSILKPITPEKWAEKIHQSV